jgi:thioredoxin-like negative regulator of GroEL
MLEVKNSVELTEQLGKFGRVLALFASSRCPFCQRFAKIFDAHMANCKVDLILRVCMDDHDGPLWDEYNIDAVPTLVLFENGLIKSRLDAVSGIGLSENNLGNWLKTVFPPL